jgi:hypothetical protein
LCADRFRVAWPCLTSFVSLWPLMVSAAPKRGITPKGYCSHKFGMVERANLKQKGAEILKMCRIMRFFFLCLLRGCAEPPQPQRFCGAAVPLSGGAKARQGDTCFRTHGRAIGGLFFKLVVSVAIQKCGSRYVVSWSRVWGLGVEGGYSSEAVPLSRRLIKKLSLAQQEEKR